MSDPAPDPVWMTYKELATALGISLPAAESRARRQVRAGRWRSRMDNEPPKAVRVLVTAAELDAMREGLPGVAEPPSEGDAARDSPQDSPGAMDPRAVNTLLDEVRATHEREAGELRRRAERAEGEVAAERARTAEAERQREEARVRAAAAEGEAKGLRDALAEARRPFWRRWVG